jgi:hypothetical protein
MLNIVKYNRKTFDVDAIQVTTENMREISEWCAGSVQEEQGRPFVKVPVNKPLDERQTKAFAGDWVLKAGSGFKVYTGKAFVKSFELVDGVIKDAVVQAAKPQPVAQETAVAGSPAAMAKEELRTVVPGDQHL